MEDRGYRRRSSNTPHYLIYVGTFHEDALQRSASRPHGLARAPRRRFRINPQLRRPPSAYDQAILAEFITKCHFCHPVPRMRQTYADHSYVLKTAADKHLNGVLDAVHAGSGMQTLGLAQNVEIRSRRVAASAKLGLDKYEQLLALILGFACCNPAELRRGVSVLATALCSH